MQGFDVHKRVTDCVHGMLDAQLAGLENMFLSEERYIRKVKK